MGLRRAGESTLRLLADLFGDDRRPPSEDDETTDATIVFADIENFSDLVARAGDDMAFRVLDVLDAAAEATTSTSPPGLPSTPPAGPPSSPAHCSTASS